MMSAPRPTPQAFVNRWTGIRDGAARVAETGIGVLLLSIGVRPWLGGVAWIVHIVLAVALLLASAIWFFAARRFRRRLLADTAAMRQYTANLERQSDALEAQTEDMIEAMTQPRH